MRAISLKPEVEMIRNEKGMTLLEIMIVLVILGSLVTILAGQVTKQLGKARVKEAKIQISQVGKALDMYYTDCGGYPGGLDGLVSGGGECENWGPDPYMKKVPKDPWNNEFIYEVDGGSYELISLGEDKREGGEGNGKDISSED